MSKESRELKRKRIRRRNMILFLVIIFVALLVTVGYYRSNESQILVQEDYINSISEDILLIKDTKFIILDNFSSSDLNYPEGTKVSGYDVLTSSPKVLNQDFLNNRITSLQNLINSGVYNNWDEYSKQLFETINNSSLFNPQNLDYFKQTACYAPSSLEELQKKLEIFTGLNTGSPIELTLTTFGIQDTGFIFSGISEYDQLANEAVLGQINNETLKDITNFDTSISNALKLVNSDHFFSLCSVPTDSLIQGEDITKELKDKYSQGLNNSEYYNMLITRVDRLRDYPQLSFNYKNQNYPSYLIDVIQEDSNKILVFILKDYLNTIANENKIKADLEIQNLKAYKIPQSAIIEKDNKTYIQLLEKGYFTEEVEVHVTSYDKGNAILSLNDNPDLNSGTSIKIYPKK